MEVESRASTCHPKVRDAAEFEEARACRTWPGRGCVRAAQLRRRSSRKFVNGWSGAWMWLSKGFSLV